MNALEHWMRTPAAAAVSWTLIHFLWQGAALALLLALALAALRGSRSRYAAACAALAAMLAAPLATLALLWPSAARIVQPGHGATRIAWPVAGPAAVSPPVAGAWYSWLGPLWFAGVLAVCGWRAAAWFAARRMRTAGVCPAAPQWETRLQELASELRLSRPVRLLESCLAEVPMVIGFLRPVILLPVGLATGLRPEQVESLLLHELAHIRRCDYLVNLVQTAIEGLLFYHPAVWWASSVIRAERENCCDDLVVGARGNAQAYAATLASLEIARSLPPRPVLAAAGGRLVDRVRRLTNPRQPAAAPLFSGIVLLAMVAVALAAWHARPADAAQQTPSQLVQKKRGDLLPDLSTPYRKWIDEDVVYIITDDERQAFERLTTDEEREHFIEQFWARRDPTPGTPENEFKAEHYRRIAYSNQHFNDDPATPGWASDRGRIYIVYGPPDEIDDHSSDNPPYQEWLYRHIDEIGDNVTVRFVADAYGHYYHQDVSPMSQNVFISTDHGRQTIVEVQPDRTAVISVALRGGAFIVSGEITDANNPAVILDSFSQTYVTSDFRRSVVLPPGKYLLRMATAGERGESRVAHVTFTVQ